ncbi:MAG: hypothetical protein H0Z37_09010 [Firmicutes bacterium]|nr:hypothetical protein [Bacillota bacterium]
MNPSPPEPAAGGALEAVVLEHSRHALLMETGSGDWIDLYVETAGGPR